MVDLFLRRLLQPKLAILDEIDSGLDIDALKDVRGRNRPGVKLSRTGCHRNTA